MLRSLLMTLLLLFATVSTAWAFQPISRTAVQYVDTNGDPASGFVLKFYSAGTTTNITLATDSTGNTLVTDTVLNADGYPEVSGNQIIPYLDEAYKIELYATQAAADANTGAVWSHDNISIGLSFGEKTVEISTNTVLTSAVHANAQLYVTGTTTLTLPAIASVENAFIATIYNAGTGLVTLNADGSETVNEDLTWVIQPDGSGTLAAGDTTTTSDWTWNGSKEQKNWLKGADVASATALPILIDGNSFDVTGTSTITSINTTGFLGTIIKLHFDGILTLTHNATDLILLGGDDIITSAGDEAEFIEYASGDYRLLNYQTSSGVPVGAWEKGADVASATALVVGTDGNYFDITGTNAITSITAIQQNLIKLQFDGVLVFTHDATNLILSGGLDITTAAGDEVECFQYASGTWRCPDYIKASGEGVLATSGTPVQKVIGTTAASSTQTTLIAFDDTIPQSSEGTEIVTVSITPKATANRLIIRGTVHYAHTVAGVQTLALFQDSTASAIAVVGEHKSETGSTHGSTVFHEMAAGTTSSTTFKLRMGAQSAGTTTINGFNAGRLYGGVLISSIEIIEVTP